MNALKILSEIKGKLIYAENQASSYEKIFVKTGKQEDRHTAMKYRERVDTINEILNIFK